MTVKLYLTYRWTCPRCEILNYAEAVISELSEEDRAEMIEDHGVDPDYAKTGNWMTHPETVTCRKCFTEFQAADGRGGGL